MSNQDVLFKEDFFERVVDINWESEPEVYWMVMTGAPLIVNGMIASDQHSWLFTSDDGIHWEGTDYGLHAEGDKIGRWGLGGIYHGGWMREGLEPGAPPVWLMMGGNGKFVCDSCAAYSRDGKTLEGMTDFDNRHACEFFLPGQGYGMTFSQSNFIGFDSDPFRTTDGRTWTPKHYHKYDPEGTMAYSEALETPIETIIQPRLVQPTAADLQQYGNVAVVNTPDPKNAVGMLHATKHLRPLLDMSEPFESGGGQSEQAKKIVFQSTSTSAQGRVRKGDYAGKILNIRISPYNGKAPAHGGPTLKVSEVNPSTGKSKTLGTANCGINRTIGIGYGHYTFVIGGSQNGTDGNDPSNNPDSSVAYSEDGLNWKVNNFGSHCQVNGIAVGPRK